MLWINKESYFQKTPSTKVGSCSVLHCVKYAKTRIPYDQYFPVSEQSCSSCPFTGKRGSEKTHVLSFLRSVNFLPKTVIPNRSQGKFFIIIIYKSFGNVHQALLLNNLNSTDLVETTIGFVPLQTENNICQEWGFIRTKKFLYMKFHQFHMF